MMPMKFTTISRSALKEENRLGSFNFPDVSPALVIENARRIDDAIARAVARRPVQTVATVENVAFLGVFR